MSGSDRPARSIDYDRLAATYDARYARHAFRGVEEAVSTFASAPHPDRPSHLLEVGCGTARWLALFERHIVKAVGVDVSAGMLSKAQQRTPGGPFVRAQAERLPFINGSFDRLLCVNALHHFLDRSTFFSEARRLLRAGGALLTIGLDPHAGDDEWWIYDYFPDARLADLARYPAAASIRAELARAGFDNCTTRVVQRLERRVRAADATRLGLLERTSTSQFMVISDVHFAEGLARIARADGASGHKLMLSADLRLYATLGTVGTPI